MQKEDEFFSFPLECYAKYKNTSADKVLSKWDQLKITDFIYGMYERYHSESIENALADIEELEEAQKQAIKASDKTAFRFFNPPIHEDALTAFWYL